MDGVNAAMRSIFEVIWAPFGAMPEWVGLFVLGAIFGVVALIAMKYTTNQARVGHFKDRYQGHILAIKLFRDSLGVVLSSLGKTLGWIGAYLGEQFKPMVVMLVPFMLLFAQMQMRLAYRPLDLGKPELVAIELDPARAPADAAISVELPPGLELSAPLVRQPNCIRGDDTCYRVIVPVVARAAGEHQLKVTCNGVSAVKSIHAGDLPGTPMVSPIRSNDFVDRLLYPTEPAFGAESPVRKIELRYPVRQLPFFGADLSFGSELGMAMVFVVLTIVAAFGLKDVFGVTI